MPRALLKGSGEVTRETAFATPKRMGNIDYWWKACLKTWPDLPPAYTQADISTEKIVFTFAWTRIGDMLMQEARTGRIHIDRTYKFGS